MGIIETAVSVAEQFLTEFKESNVQRKRQNEVNERIFELQDKQFNLKHGAVEAKEVVAEVPTVVKEAMGAAEVVVPIVAPAVETVVPVEAPLEVVTDNKAVIKQMRKDITAAGRGDEIKGCQANKVMEVHATLCDAAFETEAPVVVVEPVMEHAPLFPGNPTGAVVTEAEADPMVQPAPIAPVPAPIPTPAPAPSVVVPAVVAQPSPAPAPVATPLQALEALNAQPAALVYSKEQVMSYLVGYQTRLGDDALGVLIQAHGGASFSQVPEANWPALVIAAQA